MEWYPFYPLDFERDTAHLTLQQEAVYRRLIDWYMIHGGAPPDNDQALANILRISPDLWTSMSEIIRPFFVSADGQLRHGRCELELNEQTQQKKRWAKWQRDSRARKALKQKDICNADSQEMSSDRTGQDTTVKKERTLSHSSAQTAIPKDWKPDPESIQFAALRCVPDDVLAEQAVMFVNHYRAKGELREDWGAAFRKWLATKGRFELQRQMNGNHYPRKEDNTDAVRRGVERTVQDIAAAAGRSGVRPRPNPDGNAPAVLDAKAGEKR